MEKRNWLEIFKSLDGVAAVNLSEPSPGDLERVVNENSKLRKIIREFSHDYSMMLRPALQSANPMTDEARGEGDGMMDLNKVCEQGDRVYQSNKRFFDAYDPSIDRKQQLFTGGYHQGYKTGYRSRDGELADLRSTIAIMESRASQFESTMKATIAVKDKLTSNLEHIKSVLEAVRSQMCWDRDRDQLTMGMADLHSAVTQVLQDEKRGSK